MKTLLVIKDDENVFTKRRQVTDVNNQQQTTAAIPLRRLDRCVFIREKSDLSVISFT